MELHERMRTKYLFLHQILGRRTNLEAITQNLESEWGQKSWYQQRMSEKASLGKMTVPLPFKNQS